MYELRLSLTVNVNLFEYEFRLPWINGLTSQSCGLHSCIFLITHISLHQLTIFIVNIYIGRQQSYLQQTNLMKQKIVSMTFELVVLNTFNNHKKKKIIKQLFEYIYLSVSSLFKRYIPIFPKYRQNNYLNL